MNSQGIGLGLYFCKKIIGKLGPEERLTISSEIEKGSIFGFKIFNRNSSGKESLKSIIFSNY